MSEMHWTPVAERMPEKDRTYLVTYVVSDTERKTTKMKLETDEVRGKTMRRWKWYNSLAPWDVIAWMPLPEPYKEDMNEVD